MLYDVVTSNQIVWLLFSEAYGQTIWVYNSKAIERCLSFCSCLLGLILGLGFAGHRGHFQAE